MTALATEFDMLSERIEVLQKDRLWWELVPVHTARLLLSPLTDFAVRQRTLDNLEKNFALDTARHQTFAACKDVIPTIGRPAPDWVDLLYRRVKPWFKDDKRQKVQQAIDKLASLHTEMIERQEAEIHANTLVEAARFEVLVQHPAIVRLARTKAPVWHRKITTPLPRNAKPAERQEMERTIDQTDAVRRSVTARRHRVVQRAA